MKDYISIIYQNTQLKEGPSCIANYIGLLYLYETMSTKELAANLLLPVPVVTAIKKEMIKCALAVQKNGITLSEKGKEFARLKLGWEGIDTEMILSFKRDKTAGKRFADKLAEKYRCIFDKRPSADVTVDQAKATPETAFYRAMLCLTQDCLLGKQVLCVGDDDLVSIAMGILLKEVGCNSGKGICVFDIDQRFLHYIKETAEELDLPIECCHVDLREPLPISYLGKFDAFFTDPPYTPQGLSLFLSRGISALKKNRGQKVFLSFGNKAEEETLQMQEIIHAHGLVISEMYKDFNTYEGASVYGGISQMMVLCSTDETTPVVRGYFGSDLYTFDFRKIKRAYLCKNCGELIELSKGETIEQLKEKGCPKCSGHTLIQKKQKFVPQVVSERKSLGTHILVDYYGCDKKILNDRNQIRGLMLDAAGVANASIVTDFFHLFSPCGISGVIVIKESHFTIHTWPEYGYAAVDLFTCGNNLDLQEAMYFLEKKLAASQMEYNNVLRGLLQEKKVMGYGE